MKLSTNVFTNTGTSTLAASEFYGIMSVFVVWGLAITAGCAQYAHSIQFHPSFWAMLGLGFGLPLIGTLLVTKTDSTAIAFVGYHLICVPFGFILGPIMDRYSSGVITHAAVLTGCITLVMGITGFLYPRAFARLGGVLFVALIGIIIARVAAMFLPFSTSWIDWLSAAVFSLYIGYDMYRASDISHSVNSALNVAVSIYLDILNLFLSILSILGKKD